MSNGPRTRERVLGSFDRTEGNTWYVWAAFQAELNAPLKFASFQSPFRQPPPFSVSVNLLSCDCIPEQHGRCLGNTEHLKKKTTSALSNPKRRVLTPKPVRIHSSLSFFFSFRSHSFFYTSLCGSTFTRTRNATCAIRVRIAKNMRSQIKTGEHRNLNRIFYRMLFFRYSYENQVHLFFIGILEVRG